MKKNKLSIDKFRIATFTNLSNIRGGTSINNTVTSPSADTTFTTDTNVPCPVNQVSDTSSTSGDGTNGGAVPTFNVTVSIETGP